MCICECNPKSDAIIYLHIMPWLWHLAFITSKCLKRLSKSVREYTKARKILKRSLCFDTHKKTYRAMAEYWLKVYIYIVRFWWWIWWNIYVGWNYVFGNVIIILQKHISSSSLNVSYNYITPRMFYHMHASYAHHQKRLIIVGSAYIHIYDLWNLSELQSNSFEC